MTDYFNGYMFTSIETNFVCPEWLPGGYTWMCQPPKSCATDPSTTRQYCCNTEDTCWTTSSACASDGSTFECRSDHYKWCCWKDKEICTQQPGHINICFSSAHDTLSNISTSVLNETYLSLSSAQPSASSYTFDPLTLIAQTQTASSHTASATASAAPSMPSKDNPPPNSLSDGDIAGIVIGSVAVVAIASIVAFILVRRRQKTQNRLAQTAMSQADSRVAYPAQESDGIVEPQEMQANTTLVAEPPRASHRFERYELPVETH